MWLSSIGVTGALLVFYYELEEIAHPALFTVAPRGGEAAYRPLAEVEREGLAALPAGAKIGFAFYPRTDAASYWLMASVPAGSGGEDNWSVFVDPYTAEVLGTWLTKRHDQWYYREFFMFVFDLHYQLLMPWEVGGTVVGIIALLAMVSVLVGLYLWWPRGGHWRRALTFKVGASRERFVFDLHGVSGVYLLPVLFALLLSGVYFNLPETFFAAVRTFSPATKNRYDLTSAVPDGGSTPIGLQRAFEIVRARYPEGRPDWLYNASGPETTYTICAKDVVSVSRFADRRCVNVDQYSGAIIWVTASGEHSGWQYLRRLAMAIAQR